MWRVGVDVGGTFTDLFGWNEESGERATAKVLTTQWDRSEGVIDAIRRAAQDPIAAIESSGLPFDEISTLVHGTTTATNALIERSYPDPALVTTDGFRDTIEIGRQHREELYDPYQVKPKPIVKRRFRYTVQERTDVNGNEERPLDVDAAREVAKAIQAEGIKSIAVCFINSYVNVAHERQMRDIILEHIPDAFVMLSGEVKPLFREHGRFVTTAISAALKPVMVEYFDHLVERLQEHGFKGSVLILKSSGGVMGIDLAKAHPEDLLESGPAGGVAYTRYLAEITKTPSIICTDMGGTSFDASIVEDGKGLITRSYELEFEVPVIVPMLDIHSVGAGGGSIGWVDTGGSLRVGPRSAGSNPGPACYGTGGTEATITDANFLLGRLEPTLGGKINLDREAAEKAVAIIAEQLGIETIEAAEAMVKISCEIMAQAVKKVVIDRGRDPRDFMLVSFGGGAPGGQSWGTHIAEEGLRLPPIRAFQNNEIDPSLMKILLANTRTPHFIRGDLQAHVGCLKAAEEELQSAADRYGIDTVKTAMRELIAYTERIVRQKIEEIPDGVYEGEDYADCDGQQEGIVKVKMTVAGSNITVDLSDSDPQCLGAINSPIANTMSAVYYSLQFFFDPTAPQNEGMFEPIKVIAKEGTWLNPVWPGPTIGCTVLAAPKVASAVWQTIAKAIPDRAVGSACGDGNWFVCGVRDAEGKTDVFTDLPAGGWGGTPFNDGMNVTMDPLGNCMNMEAETAELLFPMIAYERYDLRQDSAGAGRYRGGLGANFRVRFRCEGQMNVETARTIEGTPGVNGGHRSVAQRLLHEFPNGDRKVVGGIKEDGEWTNPLLCRHKFEYGDSFIFETTGGGWGNPHERTPEEVLEDVIDEYISVEHARDVYGVSVDKAARKINKAETKALRGAA